MVNIIFLNISKNLFPAIVINSPCESHYNLAKKSIELGIPVLMESPVSKNLKEVLELYDLAKRKKVKLLRGLRTRN